MLQFIYINITNSIDTSVSLNCDDKVQLFSILDDNNPNKSDKSDIIINNSIDKYCEHPNVCNIRFINIPNTDIGIEVFLNDKISISLFQLLDNEIYRTYKMIISVYNIKTEYKLIVPNKCKYLYDLSQLKL